MNISLLGCLSKNRLHQYDTCENDYRFILDQNISTTRSLPYPEIGLWYLTLKYNCNRSSSKIDSMNRSISLTFEILSTKCTRDECGTYGVCQIITSQQNIFSTCSCVAGERIKFT